MTCRHRKPKKIPYGSKRALHWCDACDAQRVTSKPNKKRERRLANKAADKDET